MMRGPTKRRERPFFPRWTPERDQALMRLVEEKLTSSQIATSLGISRNSVIGRAHRLKLEFAHAPVGKRWPKKAKQPTQAKADSPRRAPRRKLIAGIEQIKLSQKPKVPKAASVPALIPAFLTRESYFLPLPDTPPVDLMDLEGGACHWPVNTLHGREPLFCGRHAEGPYCKVHSRIAYQPASPPKETRHGASS